MLSEGGAEEGRGKRMRKPSKRLIGEEDSDDDDDEEEEEEEDSGEGKGKARGHREMSYSDLFRFHRKRNSSGQRCLSRGRGGGRGGGGGGRKIGGIVQSEGADANQDDDEGEGGRAVRPPGLAKCQIAVKRLCDRLPYDCLKDPR
jgi:hypothetical protein